MSDIFYVNNNFKNVTLNKHFHEEYTISLVYEGAHLFANEKEKHKIVPGIIQVVNPYEIHTTNNSTWSHLNIMPTVSLVNSIAKDILQRDSLETIHFNSFINDEKASYLFISMFETFENKKADDLAVDNSVFDFLDYLLKHYSTIKQSQIIEDKRSKNSFSSTINFIDENIKDLNISLDDLSKNAGLSKFHFSREFKRNFGISPSNFIQIKKVNKVRELLKTDMSLSNIAYECGFNDQSYMIKVFRKYSGYTPSLIKKVSP